MRLTNAASEGNPFVRPGFVFEVHAIRPWFVERRVTGVRNPAEVPLFVGRVAAAGQLAFTGILVADGIAAGVDNEIEQPKLPVKPAILGTSEAIAFSLAVEHDPTLAVRGPPEGPVRAFHARPVDAVAVEVAKLAGRASQGIRKAVRGACGRRAVAAPALDITDPEVPAEPGNRQPAARVIAEVQNRLQLASTARDCDGYLLRYAPRCGRDRDACHVTESFRQRHRGIVSGAGLRFGDTRQTETGDDRSKSQESDRRPH